MGLTTYQKKRNFKKTSEPKGKKEIQVPIKESAIFVVQKHWASHLHYDFRLCINGVLKSWAIPKGPSLNPAEKRLAVMTEDHPLEYATFEGTIPAGEYGAGTVMVWDNGTWEPLGNLEEGLAKRRLHFSLHGQKLKGQWMLLGLKSSPKDWLLMKLKDEFAQTTSTEELLETNSVLSSRSKEEIENT